MSSVATTIAGIPVWLNSDGSLTLLTALAIDGDGSGGNLEEDPDFQPETSLKLNEQSLNARTVPWFVVPRPVIDSVPGVVMGCQCFGYNISNGLYTPAVVADEGPYDKIGEGSICFAQRLCIPSSPINGGTTDKIVAVRIIPNKPAFVDGITYPLKAA